MAYFKREIKTLLFWVLCARTFFPLLVFAVFIPLGHRLTRGPQPPDSSASGVECLGQKHISHRGQAHVSWKRRPSCVRTVP